MGRKLRFTRSASAWRARARGTCSCSARQRPAHPNGPTLSELKTASRTLALERKRPVKPTELFELFKEFKVGVPKLGNVPTQTVHRIHVPFDRYTQALRVKRHRGSRDTHGTQRGTHGRTRAHGSHRRTIPTHQRTHTHDRTTTETAADSTAEAPFICHENRRVGAGSFVVPTSTQAPRTARKVTHPSAAFGEVAEQRHGKGAHGLVRLALHLRKA